jgi:hypothetical protein
VTWSRADRRRLHGNGRVGSRAAGSKIASADVGNWSQVTVNIACVGEVSGAPVTISIGDVASNNDLNALASALNDAFVSVAHSEDINIHVG